MFPDVIQLGNFELYALFSKKSIAMNLGCFFQFGQYIWREIQSLDLQNKYTNDEKFRINVKKLMGLVYVLFSDVIKAYSSIATDFDVEDNDLLHYFERVWIGSKKGRGIFAM